MAGLGVDEAQVFYVVRLGHVDACGVVSKQKHGGSERAPTQARTVHDS